MVTFLKFNFLNTIVTVCITRLNALKPAFLPDNTQNPFRAPQEAYYVGYYCLRQGFSTGVPREFGGRSKRSEKKMRNKKGTLHHRADYFIQNLICHYFIEKKRGCVTEKERRGRDNFF
jgi:hypothetical protein